jgi:NSS family neurotransmitter:Na+ symporter
VSQNANRISWGTRLGFYFAAVGSAFGLGNLWRFPYVVAENGGGAFVLVYVCMAFVVGLPMLIGELVLGKSTRKTAIVAMGGSKRWRVMAAFAAFVTILVLSYYAVISGWVLLYVFKTFANLFSTDATDSQATLSFLWDHGWLQVGLAFLHLTVLMVIVLKGVEQGLEKWVGYIMPMFAVLLLTLIVQTLSLPTAGQALKFLFYPDFSKLSWSAPMQALGHTMFTLSVGFGTMVTFGSYLREQERVPSAAYRVTLLDTLISLVAGLIVFPVILSTDQTARGPGVLFQVLPSLFTGLEFGQAYGLAFFVCLYLAALTASLGLFESVVANVMDLFQLRRSTATMIVAGAILFIAVIPALSTSTLRALSRDGRSALEILDATIINMLLPLSALGLSSYVVWKMDPVKKMEQFQVSHPTARLYSNWNFMIKWVAPALVLVTILLEFTGILVMLW